MDQAVEIQRDYYRQTAADYDAMHLGDQEHEFALTFLIGAVRHFGIKSVLDIGSGTGRALFALKAAIPSLKVVGIEPSAELRERGYAKGLTQAELIDGDAQCISFPNGAFDLVVHFLNTKDAGPNFPRSASHSAMLGIKRIFLAPASISDPHLGTVISSSD